MTAAMARAPDGTPLYQVIPGAIGSSHALAAAEREGLPAEILARAAQLLPEESVALGGDTDCTTESGQNVQLLRKQSEMLITALQSAWPRQKQPYQKQSPSAILQSLLAGSGGEGRACHKGIGEG